MDDEEEVIPEIDEEVAPDTEETPVVPADEEEVPADPETPPVDASAPEDEGEYPSQYKGFLLSADGFMLHEEAFEDQDSEQGKELIAAIGRPEYFDLRAEYRAAKQEYEQKVDDQVGSQLEEGKKSLISQVNAVAPVVKDTWFSEPLDDESFSEIQAEASRHIEDFRAEKTQEYVSRGFSVQKAQKLADREVTSIPSLYRSAIDLTIREGIDSGKYKLVKVEKEEKAPTDAPVRQPVKAVPERQNSRPPVPQIQPVGRNGASNQPVISSRVVPTAAEMEMAKNLGLDPKKFAQMRRQ